MKLVVFLAVYIVIACISAAAVDGKAQALPLGTASDISLKLLPPQLPRYAQHHHHHQASTTKGTTSAATTKTTQRPTSGGSQAEIISSDYKTHPDGSYEFSYVTSDGQTRDESGYFREDATLGKILTVRGSYSYNGDDGKKYLVRYEADENGYRQEEGPSP